MIPYLNFDYQLTPRFFRLLTDYFNKLSQSGSIASVGDVTLTNGGTTTVVKNPNFAASQFVLFMPQTENAAKEWHGGTMYVSARANGSFTITHTEAAQGDRTFSYLFVG